MAVECLYGDINLCKLEVHKKVYHLENSIFLTSPFHLCHTYLFFSSTLLPIVSLIKRDKLWHDTKDIFSIYGISYVNGHRNHIISTDAEKVRNCSFKLCVHSLLHIDKQVLICYVAKIVELWCSGGDSIAISEAEMTCWMFLLLLTITLSEPIIEKRRKDCWVAKKMDTENFWVSDITFFAATPPTCVIFCHLFFVNLTERVLSDALLEWPLRDAFRIQPNICQKWSFSQKY